MKIGLIIFLIILGSFVVGFLISLIVIAIIMFKAFFGREEDKKLEKTNLQGPTYDICRDKIIEYREKIKELNFEEIKIKSFDDLSLYGRLYKCDKSKDLIILLHGAHTIPENNFGYFIHSMHDKYNLLLVRMRSHGESEGKHLTYGIKEKEDVISWLDYFGNSYENYYLYGISMGAASIGFACENLSERENVKGLIFDCGFTNIKAVMDFLVVSLHLPEPLFVPGVKLIHKMNFGFNMDSDSVVNHIKNNKIPCLFLEGGKDDVVPPDLLMKSYDACTSYKELYLVPDAGHATALIVGGENILEKVISFIERSKKNG